VLAGRVICCKVFATRCRRAHSERRLPQETLSAVFSVRRHRSPVLLGKIGRDDGVLLVRRCVSGVSGSKMLRRLQCDKYNGCGNQNLQSFLPERDFGTFTALDDGDGSQAQGRNRMLGRRWATGKPLSVRASPRRNWQLWLVHVGISLQPLQVGPHFRRALIAQIAVFLQSLVDDVFQLGGISRLKRMAVGNRIEYCFKDDSRTFAMKGNAPVAISYSTAPKREQVAPRIQFFRPHCSGDIYARSHHCARTGQMLRVHRTRLRVKRRNLARRTAGQTEFSQSEVQNLGVYPFITKMFAGLMSRWTIPRSEQRRAVGDLDSSESSGLRPSDGCRSCASASAIQKFHHDERQALVQAHLVITQILE